MKPQKHLVFTRLLRVKLTIVIAFYTVFPHIRSPSCKGYRTRQPALYLKSLGFDTYNHVVKDNYTGCLPLPHNTQDITDSF